MRSRAAALLLLGGFLVAELVTLYPGVFLRGEVIGSSALAYGMSPWKGHAPPTSSALRGNPVLSDDLTLFTPWDVATRAALAAGSTPLWNPGSGCGLPLLANNQSAVLAPTQLLRFVWDSPRARTVGLLLKVLIAGAGMFLLLGRWRLPPPAALLGGLAWANAAGITVWLLYPLSETAAWFPWLLLGLSQMLGVGGPPTRLGPLTVALAGAALLLAGHLPTAVQLLAATGAGVALLAWFRRDALRRLPAAAAAALAACLLAAPQVLPTAAYVARSHAREVRGAGIPSAAWHLPAAAAWSWAVPRGFGSPERDGYHGPLNFNEATASVGIAPLFLAFLVPFLAPGRREKALLAMVAASAAAAYGVPPLPWLAGHIPLLRWAAGQRWLILAQFGVAALAAIAVARLGQAPRRRLLLATAGVGVGLLLLITLHPALRGSGDDAGSVSAARAVLLAAGEILAVGAVLALAAARVQRAAAPLLALVTAASGLAFAWGFNPTIPVAAIPGPTEETRRLDPLRQGGRVLPVGWVLRPNTGLLAGLPTVTGVDDLIPERYWLFARWAELDALDAARPLVVGSTALIRRAGATVVLADRPIAGAGLLPLADFQGPTLWAVRVEGAHPLVAWYPAGLGVSGAAQAFAMLARTRLVDENAVLVEGSAGPLPAAAGLAQPLPAERQGPNRVRIESNQPRTGVLVLREATDPGWRVSVDGTASRPLTVDGMFLGVLLKPGPHRVVFEYRPSEWRLGLLLAALGGAGVLSFLLRAPRTRQRARDEAVVSSPHGFSPENRTGR